MSLKRVDLYVDGKITKDTWVGSCDDGSDQLCLKHAPKQIVKEVKTEKVVEKLMPTHDTSYMYVGGPMLLFVIYVLYRFKKIEEKLGMRRHA